MNRDSHDLPLTTGSDRAAASYRDGVDRLLSAWHGADQAFDRAIREDPDLALAHIARARVHQLLQTLDRVLRTPENGGLTSAGFVFRYDHEQTDDGTFFHRFPCLTLSPLYTVTL